VIEKIVIEIKSLFAGEQGGEKVSRVFLFKGLGKNDLWEIWSGAGLEAGDRKGEESERFHGIDLTLVTSGTTPTGTLIIGGTASFEETDKAAFRGVRSSLVKAHRGLAELGLIDHRDRLAGRQGHRQQQRNKSKHHLLRVSCLAGIPRIFPSDRSECEKKVPRVDPHWSPLSMPPYGRRDS
jgi:hypothetical protein